MKVSGTHNEGRRRYAPYDILRCDFYCESRGPGVGYLDYGYARISVERAIVASSPKFLSVSAGERGMVVRDRRLAKGLIPLFNIRIRELAAL